jgi:hypothetical protein
MKQIISFTSLKKPVYYIFSFALLFTISVLGFYACTNKKDVAPNNNIVKKNTPKQKSSSNPLILTYEQVGTLHNQLLARATTTLDVNARYNNNREIAKALNDNTSEGVYFLLGWETHNLGISTEDIIKNALDANYHFNPSAGWDNIIEELGSLITTREKQLLARARAVFDTDFTNMNRAQTAQYIHDQAIVLLNDYNNTTWNQNEGELAGGLLNVMKATSDFWKDQDPASHPSYTIELILHVDCVGYLAGWATALWNDYWGGGIHPDGQWRRMGCGAIAAAAMSTAGLVRNW